MLKDSGTERAQLLTAHLNEQFPASQTAWSGPPETPSYVFDMRAAGKRIVIHERIFDLWGGSKPGLEKTLAHYKIDEHIVGCPVGADLHVKPGSGEKPEFEIEQRRQS
jgi:hypothetical protein